MTPFKKLLLVVVLALAGLFIAGKIADKGYQRFWRPFYEKMDVAFKDKSNYDILFFGNSAVHFGINPYYVDSVTGLSSFNLGYGGANIVTMVMMLNGYMESHPKPKAIVFSVDHSSFWVDGEFENAFLFFDYLHNKSVNDHLKSKGYRTDLVKALPFLKYSYFDDYNRGTIIKGFDKSPFETNAFMYNGYINNKDNSVKAVQMKAVNTDRFHPSDSRYAEVFYEAIKYCKENNILLILVFPPRIYPAPPRPEQTIFLDSMIANVVNQYQIPYRRYDYGTFFNPSHFTDNVHLNKEGGTRYSILLGKFIDSCIRN